MSSVNRLIDLAKRTGDKLIVHNPFEDQDVVIMTVQNYEEILDSDFCDNCFERDVFDEDYPSRRGGQNFVHDPDVNEFEGDDLLFEEPDPWHSAASVIDDRYSEDDFENEDDLYSDDLTSLDSEIYSGAKIPTAETPWQEPYAVPVTTKAPVTELDYAAYDPMLVDNNTNPVPFHPNAHEEDWDDEPLSSDEPVFYEEPV